MTTKPLNIDLSRGNLTTYGKRGMAVMMYQRGRSFLAASALLSRARGDAYVVMHLLCQGLEIVLKAILLLVDYDLYRPQLKRLGHDIYELARAVTQATKRKPLRKALLTELKVLGDIYKAHHLRYAGMFELLVRAETVPSRRVSLASLGLVGFLERGRVFAMPSGAP